MDTKEKSTSTTSIAKEVTSLATNNEATTDEVNTSSLKEESTGSNNRSKEIINLLNTIVQTISQYTDYQMASILLFGDQASHQPRITISSSSVSDKLTKFLANSAISIYKAKRIIEEGDCIKIEALGFACYYSKIFHKSLRELKFFFSTLDSTPSTTSTKDDWQRGDGLIVPIINHHQRLLGLILVGKPRSGAIPTASSVMPILSFANQIAQTSEQIRNDKHLNRTNRELRQEKERLKILFDTTAQIQQANTLNDTLHATLQGITSIGWQCVSIYLYDEVLGLEYSVHNSYALKTGCILSGRVSPERQREIFRSIIKRWYYESCYYLRYQDSEARPIIEELLDRTWLMSNEIPQERRSNQWHANDLLLVSLYARGNRLIGLIHVADPLDGRCPTAEDCNILQLYAHESALILERASLSEEQQRFYERERAQRLELEETNKQLAAVNTDLAAANAKLQEMERLRHELTAMLVHDIRSPLTVVLGTIELLVMTSKKQHDSRITPSLASLIDVAHSTCKQIVSMVSELLELTKLQHAEMRLHKIEVVPADLIGKVVEECNSLALLKHITLNFGYLHNLKPIMGDPHFLQRALINLLTNAIKYTPNGGQIWVEARYTTEAEGDTINHYLVFTVIDSGSGIAAEELPYVFDLYYKGANSSEQISTGLGLAIVKRIALAHGGKVLVRSQIGIGSAFSIAIPVDYIAPDAPLDSKSFKRNPSMST